MCTSPYKAKWPHTAAHCPNLVANAADVDAFGASPPHQQQQTVLGSPIPVVLVAQQQRSFRSLLHLWVEWYTEYLDSHEPRLMVRFEDMLIRPDAVVAHIRSCLGSSSKHVAGKENEPKPKPFTYVVAPIKWDQKHLKPQSGMVSAIIKYGNGWDRLSNLTAADLALATEVLASGAGGRLMSLFHYSLPFE
jgi:hypothetical protein